MTVEELLARSGTGIRRRRAERREATGRQERVDGYGAPTARPGPQSDPQSDPQSGPPRPPAVPRPVPSVGPPPGPAAPAA
ncbi:MAG: Transcriptional attenuator, LytR family, partial [Modestobacter sp.]|nr:Transcriptional attenuator, LytR family [Modestobacter sp.]